MQAAANRNRSNAEFFYLLNMYIPSQKSFKCTTLCVGINIIFDTFVVYHFDVENELFSNYEKIQHPSPLLAPYRTHVCK